MTYRANYPPVGRVSFDGADGAVFAFIAAVLG